MDFGDGDKRKAEAGNLLHAWAIEVDALARGPSWRFTQCLAMDRTPDIPIDGEHFTPEQWLTCDTDAEAVKPDLRCSCQGHSESVGADVGNESTESRSAFQPLRIRGVPRGTIAWTPNHYGGAKSLRGAPKSPNNVRSTFFNTVHLPPKDFRFEHGGPNLFVTSGVQRSGDARGHCLIVCPLPNSSIDLWRVVVILSGFTLFVTSHNDVIFTFATQDFGEVC